MCESHAKFVAEHAEKEEIVALKTSRFLAKKEALAATLDKTKDDIEDSIRSYELLSRKLRILKDGGSVLSAMTHPAALCETQQPNYDHTANMLAQNAAFQAAMGNQAAFAPTLGDYYGQPDLGETRRKQERH